MYISVPLSICLIWAQCLCVYAQKVLQHDFHKALVSRDETLSKRTPYTLGATIAHQSYIYTVNVTIGHPGQNVQMAINTGSGDTFMFSSMASVCLQSSNCPSAVFNPSQSSSYANAEVGSAFFSIMYVDGSSANGSYFTDNVQMGGATIENVQMGLISNATAGSINIAQLGLGRPDVEAFCISDACASYPTFLDDLVTHGIIASRTFSLWLNDTNAPSGTILFGGVDTTKYQEPLTSFPMQRDSSGNFSQYGIIVEGVFLTSIASGQPEALASVANSPAVYVLEVDSMATIFAPAVWSVLVNSLGLQNFSSSSWWTPCDNGSVLLSFQIGGPDGPLYSAQLGDFFLADMTQTVNGTEYCGVGIDTSDNYGGVAILGEVFLRGVYAVYDLDSDTISLAASNSTGTGSNIVEIPAGGNGVPGVRSTVSDGAATTTSSPAVTTTSRAATPTTARGSSAACGTAQPGGVIYTQCPASPGVISTLGLSNPSASPSAAFTSTPATKGTASTLSGTNSVLLLMAGIAIGSVRCFG